MASSCGRLFDAVSALAGIAPLVTEFEAEAAMRLEAAAAGVRVRSAYPFDVQGEGAPYRVSFKGLTAAILNDRKRKAAPGVIAAKFHAALARLIVEVAGRAREERGVETVVLSGGVFLNKILLEATGRKLERSGFRVLRPIAFSPNDESISLGQAAFALARRRIEAVNRSG